MSKRFSTAPAESRQEKTAVKKSRNVFGVILLIVQFVLTAIIAVFSGALKILPTRYLWAGILGLMIVWFVSFLLQIPKKTRTFGKVFMIIMIIVLSIGSIYLWKTNAAMNKVFGKKIQSKVEISIIVKKDSLFESIDDLDGRLIGVQSRMDAEAMKKTMKELNAKLDPKAEQVEYGSYLESVSALMNDEVDAILLNEAHREMILETYPRLSGETKILYAATVQQEIRTDGEKEQREVDVAKETFTVYISGNDAYGEISYEGGRSDVNILLTINPSTGQILMTSTPRDMYVTLPEDVFGPGQRDKLTHAGIFGVDVSETILSKMYDVDIDYYVRINFGGFEDIVNALGGVTVHSDYAFTSKIGGYSFEKGDNYVDGAAALAFVRERYSFADGDMQRGRNQMAMIQAIIDKITSPAILGSYAELMDSLANCFITDLPKEKLGDLLDMQLTQGIKWQIVKNDVTGYGDWQRCYTSGYSVELSVLWPDEDTVEQAKQRIKACYDGEEVK